MSSTVKSLAAPIRADHEQQSFLRRSEKLLSRFFSYDSSLGGWVPIVADTGGQNVKSFPWSAVLAGIDFLVFWRKKYNLSPRTGVEYRFL
jgi:hypothetical protein